jgi:putative PIN family toxin of toxin-antitoxin system
VIRAVVDTNVLSSGLTRSTGSPRLVIDFWTDEAFELVVSEHILTELERTLANRYFQNLISQTEASDMVNKLRQKAMVTPLSSQVSGVATHPEDDLVLATAVSGNAQFLVTGDRQLLKLRDYKGIRIVDAAEFLVIVLSI